MASKRKRLPVLPDREDDDSEFALAFAKMVHADLLSGPCEDDYESTCPYLDVCPDETESEEPSPLRFLST
jgi:hypothetical protein